jgi:hypothetical protein
MSRVSCIPTSGYVPQAASLISCIPTAGLSRISCLQTSNRVPRLYCPQTSIYITLLQSFVCRQQNYRLRPLSLVLDSQATTFVSCARTPEHIHGLLFLNLGLRPSSLVPSSGLVPHLLSSNFRPRYFTCPQTSDHVILLVLKLQTSLFYLSSYLRLCLSSLILGNAPNLFA